VKNYSHLRRMCKIVFRYIDHSFQLFPTLQPNASGTDNSTSPTFLHASPYRIRVGYNCERSKGSTDCITLECSQLSYTVLR